MSRERAQIESQELGSPTSPDVDAPSGGVLLHDKPLSSDRFEAIKLLGSGSFGTATLVSDKYSSDLYVIKKIPLSGVDEKARNNALREVSVLAKLDHPHICRYYGSWLEDSPQFLCIVLEYCDGGDLGEEIRKAKETNTPFTQKQVMRWFYQLASALGYLHKSRIIHRDLKSCNVFLHGPDRDLRLGDFGIARDFASGKSMARTVVGTPYYMSPELLTEQPYSYRSDIWSLGCLLYELLTLKHPFTGNNFYSLMIQIIKGKYEPLPNTVSKGIQALVREMLSLHPFRRPPVEILMGYKVVQRLGNQSSGSQSFSSRASASGSTANSNSILGGSDSMESWNGEEEEEDVPTDVELEEAQEIEMAGRVRMDASIGDVERTQMLSAGSVGGNDVILEGSPTKSVDKDRILKGNGDDDDSDSDGSQFGYPDLPPINDTHISTFPSFTLSEELVANMREEYQRNSATSFWGECSIPPIYSQTSPEEMLQWDHSSREVMSSASDSDSDSGSEYDARFVATESSGYNSRNLSHNTSFDSQHSSINRSFDDSFQGSLQGSFRERNRRSRQDLNYDYDTNGGQFAREQSELRPQDLYEQELVRTQSMMQQYHLGSEKTTETISLLPSITAVADKAGDNSGIFHSSESDITIHPEHSQNSREWKGCSDSAEGVFFTPHYYAEVSWLQQEQGTTPEAAQKPTRWEAPEESPVLSPSSPQRAALIQKQAAQSLGSGMEVQRVTIIPSPIISRVRTKNRDSTVPSATQRSYGGSLAPCISLDKPTIASPSASTHDNIAQPVNPSRESHIGTTVQDVFHLGTPMAPTFQQGEAAATFEKPYAMEGPSGKVYNKDLNESRGSEPIQITPINVFRPHDLHAVSAASAPITTPTPTPLSRSSSSRKDGWAESTGNRTVRPGLVARLRTRSYSTLSTDMNTSYKGEGDTAATPAATVAGGKTMQSERSIDADISGGMDDLGINWGTIVEEEDSTQEKFSKPVHRHHSFSGNLPPLPRTSSMSSGRLSQSSPDSFATATPFAPLPPAVEGDPAGYETGNSHSMHNLGSFFLPSNILNSTEGKPTPEFKPWELPNDGKIPPLQTPPPPPPPMLSPLPRSRKSSWNDTPNMGESQVVSIEQEIGQEGTFAVRKLSNDATQTIAYSTIPSKTSPNVSTISENDHREEDVITTQKHHQIFRDDTVGNNHRRMILAVDDTSGTPYGTPTAQVLEPNRSKNLPLYGYGNMPGEHAQKAAEYLEGPLQIQSEYNRILSEPHQKCPLGNGATHSSSTCDRGPDFLSSRDRMNPYCNHGVAGQVLEMGRHESSQRNSKVAENIYSESPSQPPSAKKLESDNKISQLRNYCISVLGTQEAVESALKVLHEYNNALRNSTDANADLLNILSPSDSPRDESAINNKSDDHAMHWLEIAEEKRDALKNRIGTKAFVSVNQLYSLCYSSTTAV